MRQEIAEDPVFGDLALELAPRSAWGVTASQWKRRSEELLHLAIRPRVLEESDGALWSRLRERPELFRLLSPPNRRRADEGLFVAPVRPIRSLPESPGTRALLAAHENERRPPPALSLMGVVNVTPDSFSDGGQYLDPSRAIEHGLGLASEGAQLLDVGGESTRPGSDPVPPDEEIRRVVPVIEGLVRHGSPPISIDTTKASVARVALDAGATIVNDVSAGRFDGDMLPLVAERRAGYIAMHMLGTPRDMQAGPTYLDVVAEVLEFLRGRCRAALDAGADRTKLWIDPGIGFGKTLEHNLELITRLSELRSLGLPVCVGLSRKSFIAKLDAAAGLPQSAADRRIGGTAAALTFAVLGGASILRVHDVAIMAQAARVARALAWEHDSC